MKWAEFKSKALDLAELIDAFRTVPRWMLVGYGVWAAQLTNMLARWYIHAPPAERTTEVTAFVTIVLGGVFGLAVWVFKLYLVGGRQWAPTITPGEEK